MRRWRTLRRRFAATLIAICSALGIQAQAAQRLTLDDAIARVAQMHPEIRWVEARTVVLAAERERAEQLARFVARNPHLSDDDVARIDRLTRTVVGRALHAPTVRLREAAEQA